MSILHTTLIVLSILLIAIIMTQGKNSGLSIIPSTNDFGKFERRGPEKALHNITIVMVVLYTAIALALYLFA